MKRRVTQTRFFAENINHLIAKRKLSLDDFEDFKEQLATDPKQGDPIPGTGGVRKTRLRSVSKGKRGGFRVCYLDLPEPNEVILLLVYAKNEKENLTEAEKKALKDLVHLIKEA